MCPVASLRSSWTSSSGFSLSRLARRNFRPSQMLERNEPGQSLRMHPAGSSSRSGSSGSDGTFGRRGQPHQIRSARQTSSSTTVPAFSIRSAQPGNRVQPPKRVNVFAERPTPSVSFRRIYQRGDLPVCIVHESRLYRLGWKV